jgi:hypothetical protein
MRKSREKSAQNRSRRDSRAKKDEHVKAEMVVMRTEEARKTCPRPSVNERLRADARATAKRGELLVSNPALRRRQDWRSRQSLSQLAKQRREREGVREPHEQTSGGVGNESGHFQQLEAQRIELRVAQAGSE